jgi:hypothetical protein
MLIGALGCNLAWGVIDAVLYFMGRVAEKGRNLIVFQTVRRATDPQEAQHLIADALPPVVASILEPTELEAIRLRLKQLPEPPVRARLAKDDWLGGVGVFAGGLVRSGGDSVHSHAERSSGAASSNAIAIAMLFVAGYAYGSFVGRPWVLGIATYSSVFCL